MDTEFGKAALEDGDLYGKIAGHRDRYGVIGTGTLIHSFTNNR